MASPFGMVKPGRAWSAVGIMVWADLLSWEGTYSVRYINNNNIKVRSKFSILRARFKSEAKFARGHQI